MSELAPVLLLLAGAWLLAYAATRWFSRAFPTVTVYEWQRALRMVRGRLAGELGPGRYRYRRAVTELVVADRRPFLLKLSGQEVPTQDGVPVRLGLALAARIDSPSAALRSFAPETDAGDPWSGLWSAVYEAAHAAIREAVLGRPIEQLLTDRGALAEEIRRTVADRVRPWGVALEDLRIRDLTFPAELRRAFAQVPAAREEGRAALERARGEQAALRSLANAARMLEGNPNLATLRALQTLQASGGQIVLHLPEAGGPRASGSEAPEEPKQA
ncbi:MAG: slipin family protein [Fimbriimonadales bacterium]|nr:slipin family protein [Fimbriimonadales bacterium]